MLQRKRICALCAFLWLASFTVLAQGADPIKQEQQRLKSSDVEERRDAVMRLGLMRREAASRAALPALQDASPIVRATAVKAILSIGPDESASQLLSLLNDKDEFVRRETAYALGLTRSPTATAALVDRLLTDKEDGVRAAAAVAVGQIADQAAIVALVAVLAPELSAPGMKNHKREQNPFVLRAAACALGQIRSRAGTAALISALSNEKLPSDVRRESAKSLGLIGDPTAVPALRAASTAADPYLAEIAAQALKKLSRG